MIDTRIPRVYWITGLPGTGKTTLAEWLHGKLKVSKNPVLWLDGDQMRSQLFPESGYELSDRKELAIKYHNLARIILLQEISVIVSTVSMFHDIHKLNRKNFSNYLEIYLEVENSILVSGPRKKQYLSENRNQSPIQIEERPLSPDLHLKAEKLEDRTNWTQKLEDYLGGI